MADQPTSGEYRSGHDPRTLRDALGCFATGVTVVTCVDADGEPAGLTVNSFTSVSLDPPLLLVCLAKPAASAAALVGGVALCGERAADRAAAGLDPLFDARPRTGSARRPGRRGEAGAPILKDSLGVFECERYAVHDGGDHHILVGQVVKASFDAQLDPLLYFRGSYRRLHFD